MGKLTGLMVAALIAAAGLACTHLRKSEAPVSQAQTSGGNSCTTDADCGWRPDGCFQVCATAQATLQPRVECAACCDSNRPSCGCVNGQCAAGQEPAMCGGFCH